MNRKGPLFLFFLGALIGISLLFYPREKPLSPLKIALVGPMSGSSSHKGSEMRDGVELLIKQVNKEGGVNGRLVELLIFDDQNDKKLAASVSESIALHSDALIVMGHRSSSCSKIASKIYKKHQIPALTAISADPEITQDNPWYFRVIFDGEQQSRFAAYYMVKVLGYKNATLVFEESAYGKALGQGFEAAAGELGLKINYRFSYRTSDPEFKNKLKAFALETGAKEDCGMFYMGMIDSEARILVQTLRDHGFTQEFIGGNSVGAQTFSKDLAKLDGEKSRPGFYSEGVYAASYLIFDTGNQKAQKFYDEFSETYKHPPGGPAAASFDGAALAVKALLETGVTGENVKEERKKIRDYLQDLNHIGVALPGVTGLIFFNHNQSAEKSVPIGVYRNRHFVSAPVQLESVNNLEKISQLKTWFKNNPGKEQPEGIFKIGELFIQKTNVVYTGQEVIRVEKVDFEKKSFEMEFNLWFRYSGALDLSRIQFLNALEEIKMTQPEEKLNHAGMNYERYRLRGKFQMDFHTTHLPPGNHSLGFSFRHKDHPRTRLIFVGDILNLGATSGAPLVEKLKSRKALQSVPDWGIHNYWFFQDHFFQNTYGNPLNLAQYETQLEFSRFNMEIRLKKNSLNIRGVMPYSLALKLFFLGLIALFIPIFYRLNGWSTEHRLHWLLKVSALFLLLLSSEVLFLHLFLTTLDPYYFDNLRLVFDLLWWFIPAYLINSAIEDFVWKPIEKQTARNLPNLVRGFVGFLIFLLALFGVIAFVFEQKLTSLLATSSVLAMIVGLAIQVNISNIFSGMAINMENPFRIGNWIKIGNFEEGRVVDITWRTTRIKTRNECLLLIPNAMAAENPIQNFSFPTESYENFFPVKVSPLHSPEKVQKIILDALMASDTVLHNPPPVVRFRGIQDGIAEYSAIFTNADYGKKHRDRQDAWLNIWNHLNRAGISLAVHRQDIHIFKGKQQTEEMARSPETILNDIEIFKGLSQGAKEDLSNRMKRHYFSPNETVFSHNEKGDSLFIIVEGVISLNYGGKLGKEKEMARVGAGNFIGGEFTFFSDESRISTAQCLSPTILYEFQKNDLVSLIEEQPSVIQLMSEVLSQRKIMVQNLQNLDEKGSGFLSNQREHLFNRVMKLFSFGQERGLEKTDPHSSILIKIESPQGEVQWGEIHSISSKNMEITYVVTSTLSDPPKGDCRFEFNCGGEFGRSITGNGRWVGTPTKKELIGGKGMELRRNIEILKSDLLEGDVSNLMKELKG